MTVFLGFSFAATSIAVALSASKLSMGRSWAISPLALFVAVSIVFINIGFLIYFLDYAGQQWAFDALVSASAGLLCIGFGGAFGVLALGTAREWSGISHLPVGRDIPYSIAVTTALVVFGITLIYFYFLGYVPLLAGIKVLLSEGLVAGLGNTLRVARDVYVNPEAEYIPLQGLLEIVRYFGLPVIGVWFLHYYRVRKHRLPSLLLLVSALFLSVLTGQRWPLMYMLVTLLAYWSLTNRRVGRAFGGTAVVAVVAGGVLSVFLGRQVVGTAGPLQGVVLGIRDLFQRIFTGNVHVPFLSYEIFPDHQGWLYGSSWVQNLKAYLPGPSPSFPVSFYQLVTHDPRGFSAPPDFYTEAYINFGLGGVVFLSFLWGFLLVGLQLVIARTRSSLFSLSVSSLSIAMIGFSSMSGVSFVLGGLIVVAILGSLVWGLKFLFPSELRRQMLNRANSGSVGS